jgi:hypothetical protein
VGTSGKGAGRTLHYLDAARRIASMGARRVRRKPHLFPMPRMSKTAFGNSLFDLSAKDSCLLFWRKRIALDLLRQFCQSFLPMRIALS